MDVLTISGLECFANIGVFDWEQAIKQKLYVDISLDFKCDGCLDDELGSTIDYDKLCEGIQQLVSETSFKLIERLAEVISQYVLTEFELVEKITLTINKPKAVMKTQNISFTIQRQRCL